MDDVIVRVFVEHAPDLVAMLGLVNEQDCTPVLTLTRQDGSYATFYRHKSTNRWVYYKPSLTIE